MANVAPASRSFSPAAIARSFASRTVRPLRLGLRKSKPSDLLFRVSSSNSPAASARSSSSRAMWVSFAWACFALLFLYRNRSTKRSSRAMSTPTRSAVFAAAAARAAFSRRQTCQGPGKKSERPASSSRTPVVTASRNQRSWATRMTAASSDCSSCSSHSRLATSRWFVGSSSSSRSGSPAQRAGERGARQLAAREGRERPVQVLVQEAEAAERAGRALAPVVAARMLEPCLSLGVARERRGAVVAVGHRLLERSELILGRGEIGRALRARTPAG